MNRRNFLSGVAALLFWKQRKSSFLDRENPPLKFRIKFRGDARPVKLFGPDSFVIFTNRFRYNNCRVDRWMIHGRPDA